jgi:hypothetical protein
LFQPAFGPEDLRVRPDVGVCNNISRSEMDGYDDFSAFPLAQTRKRTHVASPRVEEEHCALRDQFAVVGNVLDRRARQRQPQDGKESSMVIPR